MTEIFPLTGFPKYFLPTASANFVEAILEDIVEHVLYPYERESDPNKCCPTILNINPFIYRMSTEEAVAMVDEFSRKQYKKHSINYFEEVYHTDKIKRELMLLKPTCFLILGEPNDKHYKIGECFAKDTNRVHLDVVDLINLEMSRATLCGKWMYTNLSEGRCIPISIVLYLLDIAINQEVVKERGYVLTGLPIITEKKFCAEILPTLVNKMENLKSPPESLISEWTKKNGSIRGFLGEPMKHFRFESAQENALNVGEDEFAEEVSTGFTKMLPGESESNSISEVNEGVSDDLANMLETVVEGEDPNIDAGAYLLYDMMSSANLKKHPSEEDVLRSVHHQANFLLHLPMKPDIIFFIRSKKSRHEFDQPSQMEVPLQKTTLSDLRSSDESQDERLDNATRQHERYLRCLPHLGKFVFHYNKECIVKVTAHFSVEETLRQIKFAITFINYKRVHIPERIIIGRELRAQLSKLLIDERLDALCEYQCIQPNFKWLKLDVEAFCPVELDWGKMEHGRIEYAIRYAGHVILLSSFQAMSTFLANPSRYFFSKPNCRVAIVSDEINRVSNISLIFRHIFHANSFNWRSVVRESLDIQSMDIYKEAQIWATQFYASISKARVQGSEYEAIIMKLTECRFFELYKEKHPAKIAEMTIDWMKTQDRQLKDPRFYAQWILEDAPMELEYWKRLKSSDALPDNVIFLRTKWDGGDDPHLSVLLEEDIAGISSTINACFSWLFSGDRDINLEKIVMDASMNQLSDTSFTSALLKLPQKVSISMDEGEDALNVFQAQEKCGILMDYLKAECIRSIVSYSTGQRCGWDILEKYLGIFKPKAKVLKPEDIEKLGEIDQQAYDHDPKLARECFLNPESLYQLNLSYLNKNAEFQYISSVEDTDKTRNVHDFKPEETDEDEDQHEEHDASHEIDLLSQSNINNMVEKDVFSRIPLGNTGKYCPVTLRTLNMLRLGKLQYTVEYESKLYSLSSQKTMEEFLQCPFRYTFNGLQPYPPPYRICVIGPTGPSRHKFCRYLSQQLGVKTFTYSKLMIDFLNSSYSGNSAILDTMEEVYDEYGRDFVSTALKEVLIQGIILEGFPNDERQLRDMLHHKLYPEVVYIMEGEPEQILHYAFLENNLRLERQLQFKYRNYLSTLDELAKKSLQKSNRDKRVEHIRLESQYIQNEVREQKARIQTMQDQILYRDGNYRRDTLRHADIPSHLSTEDDGSMLFASPTLRSTTPSNIEDEDETVEEELPEILPNPIPTVAEKTRAKQVLLKTTKINLRKKLQNLRVVIKMLIDNNVPIVSIPWYFENEKKVRTFTYSEWSQEIRKNIFDQVIVLPLEAAKKCLRTGYAHYSHFQKFCPVDSSNLMPINLHYSSRNKKTLYSCIYRNLIYYVNGKDNMLKFRQTPRFFTSQCKPFFTAIPLRLLIIGPPYSGVTTLCERIANEFHLAHLKKEHFFLCAQRVVSDVKIQKEFAKRRSMVVKDVLPKVNLEVLGECIQAHRSDCSNGIVLDNYPITPRDFIESMQSNIGFHLLMIIKSNFSTVWSNWKAAYTQAKHPVRVPVIQQLASLYQGYVEYDQIMQQYESLPPELDLFNIVYLKGSKSKWGLWEEAKNEILLSLREIGNYIKNVRNGRCVGISRLNIFQAEFEKRLSPIRLFCPVCLKDNGRLIKYRHDYFTVPAKFYAPACQRQFNEPYGYNQKSLYKKYDLGSAEDISHSQKAIFTENMFKTNLVQYGAHFYWTCDKHRLDILLNGSVYLPPETFSYPPYLPFLVTNYFHKDVANDGYCLPTYYDNFSKETYVMGDPNYPIFYRGKIFLCASEAAALQFLQKPQFFYKLEMPSYKESELNLDLVGMQIDYGRLPEAITEALIALADIRPKHIALNIKNSAAIFIGLFLKTINSASSLETIKLYEEMYSKYNNECAYLKWLIRKFHDTENPYIRL